MPAEGPVPFRRDHLPMDGDSAQSLAEQLLVLARGRIGAGPAELRSAAQMLAVASALRPGDEAVAAVAKSLREGESGAGKPAGNLVRVHSRIWQRIDWLNAEEAAVDGRALSACLEDVMAAADPKHPRAVSLRGKAERGAWDGWVAPLAEFEGPATPGHASVSPLLESASVEAPMWVERGSGPSKRWEMDPVALEMKAVAGEGAPGISVVLGSEPMSESRAELAGRIARALRPPVIKGVAGPVVVSVDSRGFDKALRSGGAMSVGAAAAVLAGSAVNGKVPHGLILGRVEPDGRYLAGSGFWEQLRALSGKGKGRRLIVPASAEREVLSLLVVDETGYFFDYEILMAKDLAGLLEAAALPEDAPEESPCGRFRTLRERAAAAKDLNEFLNQRWVREYLGALRRIGPDHLSAKALHLKSTGARPSKFTRPVLISELRRAMQPLDFLFAEWDPNDIKVLRKIDDLGSGCSDKIDKISRLADSAEAAWVESARDAVDSLRSAARDQRKQSGQWMPDLRTAARIAISEHYRKFLESAEKEAPTLSAP